MKRWKASFAVLGILVLFCGLHLRGGEVARNPAKWEAKMREIAGRLSTEVDQLKYWSANDYPDMVDPQVEAIRGEFLLVEAYMKNKPKEATTPREVDRAIAAVKAAQEQLDAERETDEVVAAWEEKMKAIARRLDTEIEQLRYFVENGDPDMVERQMKGMQAEFQIVEDRMKLKPKRANRPPELDRAIAAAKAALAKVKPPAGATTQ